METDGFRGTTTVALLTKDSLILAAERKITYGYLDMGETPRIFKLDNHIAITTSGMLADLQSVIRILKANLNILKLERGEITVKSMSKFTANMLHQRRMFPYLTQLMIGGYDSKPELYTLDIVGGRSAEDSFAATGTGLTFAYGVLESNYKKDISEEDAKKLAYRSVKAAIRRDVTSGGKIDVAKIDKDGFKFIDSDKLA